MGAPSILLIWVTRSASVVRGRRQKVNKSCVQTEGPQTRCMCFFSKYTVVELSVVLMEWLAHPGLSWIVLMFKLKVTLVRKPRLRDTRMPGCRLYRRKLGDFHVFSEGRVRVLLMCVSWLEQSASHTANRCSAMISEVWPLAVADSMCGPSTLSEQLLWPGETGCR